MCLERITNMEPVTEGYKVFTYDPLTNKLVGDIFSCNKPRPINKWLYEKDYRELRSVKIIGPNFNDYYKDGHYKTGWHVFHSYSAAVNWCNGCQPIRKVKIKDPIVVGCQQGEFITVCKQILILPKNKQPKGYK